VTAGPPTDPPILILTAEQVRACVEGVIAAGRDGRSIPTCGRQIADSYEALRVSRDVLRARLRDAEETLRAADEVLAGMWSFGEAPRRSRPTGLGDASRVIRAYFERHADPQETQGA